MPEDLSDHTENKHFPCLLCPFPAISDRLSGRYSHRGVTPLHNNAPFNPAIKRVTSSVSQGKEFAWFRLQPLFGGVRRTPTVPSRCQRSSRRSPTRWI